MTKGLEIGLNQIESLPIAEENSAADPELKLSTSAQISNLNTAKTMAFPSTSPPLSSGSETEKKGENGPRGHAVKHLFSCSRSGAALAVWTVQVPHVKDLWENYKEL